MSSIKERDEVISKVYCCKRFRHSYLIMSLLFVCRWKVKSIIPQDPSRPIDEVLQSVARIVKHGNGEGNHKDRTNLHPPTRLGKTAAVHEDVLVI